MRSFLSALLLSMGLASAQDAVVSVRTMSLSGRGFPETFLPVADGYEAVRFSAIQPSERLSISAKNPLPVFFSAPDKKEGETIKPDALVKLPSAKGGILLFGWEAEGTRKFVALPDNLGAGSGPDKWLLVNATSETIAFQLGEKTKPTIVKPGTSVPYRISVELGKGAPAKIARVRGKEATVVFSTFWEVDEEQRCLVYLRPGRRPDQREQSCGFHLNPSQG